MKRIPAVILLFSLLLSLLSGCGGVVGAEPNPAATGGAQEARVAFITGIGDIHDHSFNEDCYTGVQLFAQESGAECKYFQPPAFTEEELLKTIQTAVDEGYNIIVMAGFLFAKPCLRAALDNPNVSFLAISVTTADMGVAQIPKNISLLIHREEQAGFLAGYAAVLDGYRELGFLGGMEVSAVVKFGHGYIQGAERAAKDLGVDDVRIRYWYSGSFVPSEAAEEKMNTWYSEGTEVVFSCGGAVYESCLKAAEAQDGYMIGVDVDQSYISPRFLISAVKSLQTPVLMALRAAAGNNLRWPGAYAGTCQALGVDEGCIGLSMETSKLRYFTEDMYGILYKAMGRGSISVECDGDLGIKPQTKHVTVIWE